MDEFLGVGVGVVVVPGRGRIDPCLLLLLLPLLLPPPHRVPCLLLVVCWHGAEKFRCPKTLERRALLHCCAAALLGACWVDAACANAASPPSCRNLFGNSGARDFQRTPGPCTDPQPMFQSRGCQACQGRRRRRDAAMAGCSVGHPPIPPIHPSTADGTPLLSLLSFTHPHPGLGLLFAIHPSLVPVLSLSCLSFAVINNNCRRRTLGSITTRLFPSRSFRLLSRSKVPVQVCRCLLPSPPSALHRCSALTAPTLSRPLCLSFRH
jgi:hypothetical protein